MKDNAASISDDGRYVSFRGSFESATMKGTHEPYVPGACIIFWTTSFSPQISLANSPIITTPTVSKRNVFLYDAKLGITWGYVCILYWMVTSSTLAITP